MPTAARSLCGVAGAKPTEVDGKLDWHIPVEGIVPFRFVLWFPSYCNAGIPASAPGTSCCQIAIIVGGVEALLETGTNISNVSRKIHREGNPATWRQETLLWVMSRANRQ